MGVVYRSLTDLGYSRVALLRPGVSADTQLASSLAELRSDEMTTSLLVLNFSELNKIGNGLAFENFF